MSDNERNIDGTFSDNKIGSKYVSYGEQKRIGINTTDSEYTAGQKVFKDDMARHDKYIKDKAAFNRLSKDEQARINLLIAQNTFSAGKFICYIFFLCLMGFGFYSTYPTFSKASSEFNRYQGAVPKPIVQETSSAAAFEADDNAYSILSILRAHYEQRIGALLTNPRAIKSIWSSCDSRCQLPSTASQLKFLPYVKKGQEQEFLKMACHDPHTTGLEFAQIEVVGTNCHVTNYAEMKEKALHEQHYVMVGVKHNYYFALVKILGLGLLTLFGTIFYLKRKNKA